MYYVVSAVVPVVVGAAALWFSRRLPALGQRPAWTALGLFVLLDVVNALDSPGGDLLAPTIGLLVSIVVSIAFYVALRRSASAGDAPSR
jgi:hypothetical protein